MADLAARMPLLEKQHQVVDMDRNTKLTFNYLGLNSSDYLSHVLHPNNLTAAVACKENTSVLSTEAMQTEKDRFTDFAEESTSLGSPRTAGSAQVPVSYMHAGGFRYQIRRPVESWKFLEVSHKIVLACVHLCMCMCVRH